MKGLSVTSFYNIYFLKNRAWLRLLSPLDTPVSTSVESTPLKLKSVD